MSQTVTEPQRASYQFNSGLCPKIMGCGHKIPPYLVKKPRKAAHGEAHKPMMRTLTGFLAVAMLVCFTGCKPAETLDDTTKLIYLVPSSPCETGDPGFGNPTCYIKRKRDAVVVLRVPKHFRTSPPESPRVSWRLFGLSRTDMTA